MSSYFSGYDVFFVLAFDDTMRSLLLLFALSLFLSLNLVVGVGKESFVSWIAEAILHLERQESFFFSFDITRWCLFDIMKAKFDSPFFLFFWLSLSLSFSLHVRGCAYF